MAVVFPVNRSPTPVSLYVFSLNNSFRGHPNEFMMEATNALALNHTSLLWPLSRQYQSSTRKRSTSELLPSRSKSSAR